MKKTKLLIVDDDETIRTQMKWSFAEDHEVLLAEDRKSAVGVVVSEAPAVVLLDLGLPPEPNDPTEGFLTLGEILSKQPDTKVIIITGQGDRENAIKAVGEGAYDFMSKPIDTDELRIVLTRAYNLSRLEHDFREIQQKQRGDTFEGMLGSSPQMQAIFTAVRKVAGTDAPVLILGESGTGKEMVARGIHARRARKDGPFIAINCSAIPEPLLESELFGHEKGSFTGAHEQRKGRIESASGGTLFLDEIGELPGSLQAKLLRFLQERQIERVGGRKAIEIDTRVISATNINLQEGMVSGAFREDLFYRLAVVVLRLPALREREGDAAMLGKIFLNKFAEENNMAGKRFSQKATRAMENYSWPGNVRELENRVRRAVIMSEGQLVKPEDLEIGSAATDYEGATLKEARDAVEKTLIDRALQVRKGNISRAAEDLGISRPTLYELMSKLGIQRP